MHASTADSPGRAVWGHLPTVVTVGLGLSLLVDPVAAQGVSADTGASLVVRAGVTMGIVLAVGGGLVVFAPDTAEAVTDGILDRPLLSFGVGLVASVVLGVVLFALVATGIGTLLAIPLVLATPVVVGFGYLAAGRTVGSTWQGALPVAVLLAGVVGGVPLVGSVVGLVVGSLGLGGVALYLLS